MRSKLHDSSQFNSYTNYHPAGAQKLIPQLKICWGSIPRRRESWDHVYGECQCESRSVTKFDKGRIETTTASERNTVLAIFSRHFSKHPLIPDRNGTYRSSHEIHQDCAEEMYEWCKARNYFRLWSYLWVNWYASGQWELWARSANAHEMPVLKTTMIMESHWRRLKHDYLHRFNRPRIDLVCWVLTTRAVPQALDRMKVILAGGSRTAKASWRKGSKKQWKELRARTIDPQSLDKYHTNPGNWTCACEGFLLSRFLICKHTVSCFEDFEDIRNPIEFFAKIRRQRLHPFWVSEQLNLRPEFIPTRIEKVQSENGECDSSSDEDLALNATLWEESQVSEDEEPTRPDRDQFLAIMNKALQIYCEQDDKGNKKFTDRFIDSHSKTMIHVAEIERRRNRRTMPQTWSQNDHPATMFYR